jgi:beta-phosphoglucomutase-like phosphatase (HAD superfamily)
MPTPKAILFDVDGTAVDTVHLHAAAWVQALEHFAVEVPFEDMRLQIGKGGDRLLRGLLPAPIVESTGEEIQAFHTDLFKRDYMHKAQPFPGVRELSQRIRAEGQRAVLASSGRAEEVAGPSHILRAYQDSPLAGRGGLHGRAAA